MEQTLEIEIPGGKHILCSRPIESLAYDEYQIRDLQKKIDHLINVEEVREDSKRVTSLKMRLNKHESRLFQWGFTKTRNIETTEIEKTFVLD